MRVVERSIWVPFNADQMYNLVNDITKYPQFLPGCKSAEVLYQGKDEVHAALTIEKSGITQGFSTRNELQQNHQITMTLLEGPFRYLKGVWRFNPKASGCEIAFVMEFEFQSKLMDFSFGPIFESITHKMVQAFTERAKEVYATPV